MTIANTIQNEAFNQFKFLVGRAILTAIEEEGPDELQEAMSNLSVGQWKAILNKAYDLFTAATMNSVDEMNDFKYIRTEIERRWKNEDQVEECRCPNRKV